MMSKELRLELHQSQSGMVNLTDALAGKGGNMQEMEEEEVEEEGTTFFFTPSVKVSSS